MNLPKDGTNQLPKAGFDWIALNVIFQGRKGLNLPLFSNIDIYCSFIQKRSFSNAELSGVVRRRQLFTWNIYFSETVW